MWLLYLVVEVVNMGVARAAGVWACFVGCSQVEHVNRRFQYSVQVSKFRLPLVVYHVPPRSAVETHTIHKISCV